ncbi:MAG: peptidase M23 [Bacteroidota bacterium]
MKKSILTLAAFAFITGAVITSCNTPAEKVEIAQDNVTAANDDLDKANTEYLVDIENYRKEVAAKIATNDKSIAEFNARIESKKEAAKADYKKKVAELEQKNTDIKRRLDEYKAEGKNNWKIFKIEFSRDLEELGKAFKDLAIKNV